MKKNIILISALFLSLSVYGQKQENNFQVAELLKFESTKEKLYSNLNKENTELTILYTSGIYAYIYIDKQESEDVAIHTLNITYFIPKIKSFVKDKKNKKEILNFIKQEIDKNNFLLQTFFDDAYKNALSNVGNTAQEEKQGFSVHATNQDFSSELVIHVCEVHENQYVISVYYKIGL